MTVAASVAPSLDYNAIGTAIAILASAVGAVIYGVFKGWKAIKESITAPGMAGTHMDEKVRVVSAAIVETQTLSRLTEANAELRGAVCELERTLEDHNNETKLSRYAMQQVMEALQRLASAVEHNSRVIERTGLKL